MAKSSSSGETKAPLVIALVFFVLSTIGLGVFAYMTMEDLTLEQAKVPRAVVANGDGAQPVVDDPLQPYQRAAVNALIAPAIEFHDLPTRLADILAPQSGILCQLVTYPPAASAA